MPGRRRPAKPGGPKNGTPINRQYGFGTSAKVTIGGVPATCSGGDLTLTCTVPQTQTRNGNGNGNTGVQPCLVQQQAQYGGSTAYCGELVITAAKGKQSIDSVTVTIGGKAPTHVPASSSIQSAIDAAAPGDLIIVDPTCTTPAGVAATCAITGQNHSPGAHNELLIMWKPVRLQGVGAASSIINANTHPPGKLDLWRVKVG